MCSHYQTLKDAELLLKKFGTPPSRPLASTAAPRRIHPMSRGQIIGLSPARGSKEL